MADTMKFELVTPLCTYTGEDAKAVNLPAESGYMGILPGHDVMIVSLGIGEVSVEYPDHVDTFFATRGYVEIEGDIVRILAEICEEKSEIDIERAKQGLERAESRMKENADDIDIFRAQDAIMRSAERLRIAGALDRN